MKYDWIAESPTCIIWVSLLAWINKPTIHVSLLYTKQKDQANNSETGCQVFSRALAARFQRLFCGKGPKVGTGKIFGLRKICRKFIMKANKTHTPRGPRPRAACQNMNNGATRRGLWIGCPFFGSYFPLAFFLNSSCKKIKSLQLPAAARNKKKYCQVSCE